MTFTNDAQKEINRLRAYKQHLIAHGYTSMNAIQKVEHENGHIDGTLVAFACGTADIREVPAKFFV